MLLCNFLKYHHGFGFFPYDKRGEVKKNYDFSPEFNCLFLKGNVENFKITYKIKSQKSHFGEAFPKLPKRQLHILFRFTYVFL